MSVFNNLLAYVCLSVCICDLINLHFIDIIVTTNPNKIDTTVGSFANYTCTATYYTRANIQINWDLTRLICDNEKITIHPSYVGMCPKQEDGAR